ncbi:MAG: endonuclease V [Saprospiraceae bacterium]|nr:endonuclease V [Saprospiraceae bacterium]
MDIKALEAQQIEMAQQVVIPSENEGYHPSEGDILVTFDVQYIQEEAFVALDVQEWKGAIKGTFLKKLPTPNSYVPSFFAFREGPVLWQAYQALIEEQSIKANCLLIDGHGIAHPRQFGVASWLGVKTSLPTVGCAKQTLLKFHGGIASNRGATLNIQQNKQTLGFALRTQTATKPVFVSPGHLISLSQSVDIILEFASRYRLPEPIRRADQAARAFAKNELEEGWNAPMLLG